MKDAQHARRQPAGLSTDRLPPDEVLQEQVALLQRLTREVEALVDDGLSLAELLRILDTIGRGSSRIIDLLKAQQALGGPVDMVALLSQALTETIEDLKCKPPARS
jgi:hypothetical protein